MVIYWPTRISTSPNRRKNICVPEHVLYMQTYTYIWKTYLLILLNVPFQCRNATVYNMQLVCTYTHAFISAKRMEHLFARILFISPLFTHDILLHFHSCQFIQKHRWVSSVSLLSIVYSSGALGAHNFEINQFANIDILFIILIIVDYGLDLGVDNTPLRSTASRICWQRLTLYVTYTDTAL